MPNLKLLVITGIFPPDIGGPATYVPMLAVALATQGYRLTVLTLSDVPAGYGETYPFTVIRIRRKLLKPLRFILTVIALMRHGWRADLLFANGLYLEVVLANFILRKPLAQKWVGDWAWERATNRRWVTANFEEFQRRDCGFRAELLKRLRNMCIRRADAVIVPSRYLATAVAAWGVPSAKISPIYNAVESVVPLSTKLPLPTKTNLVTAGRLIALKSVDRLIGAVAQIDGIGLVIIGDGPERSQLEQMARRLGIGERVYFAGQRSREETLALMAACDLFVLNSIHEGFPHVVLEAMSVGLPVMATAVGGTPELVRDGENGSLISPSLSGALAPALLEILSSPVKRQRLVEGAKQTLERFHPTVMIEETEAVLRHCAHRHA
jgi:glycosyltransferase involved in cell wall biosynthesis